MLTDIEFAQALTESERREVVGALAEMAEKLYVDTAKGKRIAAQVRRQHSSGRYRGITDPAAFAIALTDDMRFAVPDKHLKVRVQRFEPQTGTSAVETPEAKQARRERFRRSAAYDGYGIRELKILPGNVGYLSLGEFWAPSVAGDALSAAMAMLKGADALIIDLRDSYGGHEDVALLLMGHLLPEPQHVFTSNDQLSGEVKKGMSVAIPASERLKAEAPIYVLTKGKTFSAAEALTLALKRKRNAVVVGEQTRGGANGGDFRPLTCRFDAFIPYFGSTVDGISWEGVGIAPDVNVPAEQALDEAYRRALSALVEMPNPPDADSLDREIRDERRKLLQDASKAGN